MQTIQIDSFECGDKASPETVFSGIESSIYRNHLIEDNFERMSKSHLSYQWRNRNFAPVFMQIESDFLQTGQVDYSRLRHSGEVAEITA